MSTENAEGGPTNFTGESCPQISQITQIPGRWQLRENTDKHGPETQEDLVLRQISPELCSPVCLVEIAVLRAQ
jgi:hypothetical protein